MAEQQALDPDTEYSLLNGQDKASILLSSLGMNITQLIFSNMKDNDVKRMINAMANVKRHQNLQKNFGWVDFDPTNNKIPNEEYIILGHGRDYLDISPLKGVVQSSGGSILGVKVNVEEIG